MIDGQLSFDLSSIDDLPDAEAAAIAAEFLARYSTAPDATTPRPCVCEGMALVFLDAMAAERRCAKCGRQPTR